VECEVIVEKNLTGRGSSIVKTSIIMDWVQNSGIALAIVALFLFSSNSHKMKI
jgi:hypothetical protein